MKLTGWWVQYWTHQIYTSDKLALRMMNQTNRITDSKWNIYKLGSKKVQILKRWEAVKEYLEFRAKLSEEFNRKEENINDNIWKRFLEKDVERERRLELAYNKYAKGIHFDMYGISYITKDKFVVIAYKEKLVHFQANDYKKDPW
jgi:hypothetical protein